MIQPNNIRLGLGSITPKASDKDAEVADVLKIPKRENGKPTSELACYAIDIVANRGATQKIKLPLELADKITELKTKIDDGAIVRVKFVDLKMRLFNMKTETGNLVGITASASDFEITKIESSEDDIDNIFL